MLQVLKENGGHLYCADRDPDALASAGARLEDFTASGHATLLHSNFASLPSVLRATAAATTQGSAPFLDGILLDLGVSSHQLNEPSRGFSYRFDGPLDMRMDRGQPLAAVAAAAAAGLPTPYVSRELTAETILNSWSAEDIASILWRYGEERQSRFLARALVAARPLTSTGQVKAVLEKVAPGPPKLMTKRLARVFQALRIEVNGEMAELETILTAASSLIRPGGRLAVMSYHSLEDGPVKRLLRSGSLVGDAPPKDAYGNTLSPWLPITRQPVVASEEEIKQNSRARSVRLRVGERTTHPVP